MANTAMQPPIDRSGEIRQNPLTGTSHRAEADNRNFVLPQASFAESVRSDDVHARNRRGSL